MVNNRGDSIIDVNKLEDSTSPEYRAAFEFFGDKVLIEHSQSYKSAQALTLSFVEQYDPFAEFKK